MTKTSRHTRQEQMRTNTRIHQGNKMNDMEIKVMNVVHTVCHLAKGQEEKQPLTSSSTC